MNARLGQQLMDEFAEATGLSGAASPRRYLWTDAFAVCNFLGLCRQTGSSRYLQLALDLVDQVHHVLGRHRPDDQRQGWISGLQEQDGQRHPTCGGLRIGKPRNERAAAQPPNARLEWEQDGQYFHYLTKWMHALLRVSQETDEDRYWVWAAELAATAHHAFTSETSPSGGKRMFWKMSIDLSRPLVASMGHHDPLDGLVTVLALQAYKSPQHEEIDLTPAVADMAEMCGHGRWATDDPLGIGGLLHDAARLAAIVYRCDLERRGLLVDVLRESHKSLRAFAHSPALSLPAEHRLAFRELGLSIGLRTLGFVGELVACDTQVALLVDSLREYRSCAEEIEAFWADPVHRHTRLWNDHRDINMVMLATSLAPRGLMSN